MLGGSNTGSNSGKFTPTDEEKAMLKQQHRISWHPKGGWCRVFPGDKNRTYFGHVPPGDAVRAMIDEENSRRLGQRAEAKAKNLSLGDAVNLFLTHLDRQLATGKIKSAQRASYGDELERMVAVVGRGKPLRDFTKFSAPESIFRPLRETALARGVYGAEKHIIQVRTFLRWCSDVRRLIPAPFWADAFNPPGEKEKRAATKQQRRAKGIATWTAEEVRQIIQAGADTDVHTHAQLLLMINGGMGATDLAELDDADVDWGRRCIHTDRSKTLVPRVIPLWDETIEKMKASRAARPAPKRAEWSTRFFLTKRGEPLVLETLYEDRKRVKRKDSLKNWFYRLVNGEQRVKWKTAAPRLPHLKRHRAGLYTLRSVFTTLSIGYPGGDRNLEAVILGQTFDRPIIEFYLRGDLREKLVVVVDHVRRQIWPEQFAPQT